MTRLRVHLSIYILQRSARLNARVDRQIKLQGLPLRMQQPHEEQAR